MILIDDTDLFNWLMVVTVGNSVLIGVNLLVLCWQLAKGERYTPPDL